MKYSKKKSVALVMTERDASYVAWALQLTANHANAEYYGRGATIEVSRSWRRLASKAKALSNEFSMAASTSYNYGLGGKPYKIS
jgi:hypothetical protein